MTSDDRMAPPGAERPLSGQRGWTNARRIAALVVTVLLCGGCDSASALATDFSNRTAPVGDPRPTVSSPIRAATWVRYEWDVDTRMPPDAYAQWVAISLRSLVDVVASDPPDLLFGRYRDGDLLRLQLQLEPTPHGTHVHAVFVAMPD